MWPYLKDIGICDQFSSLALLNSWWISICFVLQINVVICKDICNALCIDLWQKCFVWLDFSFLITDDHVRSIAINYVTWHFSQPLLLSLFTHPYIIRNPSSPWCVTWYMYGPLAQLTIKTHHQSSLCIHTSCTSRCPLCMGRILNSLHRVHDLYTRCVNQMNSVNVLSYGLLGQSSLRCVHQGDLCKCVGLWTLSTELTMHTHAV